MANFPTQEQISAGGVAFRRNGPSIEVVLIAVGEANRWQLPKGLIDKDERVDAAAMREVQEETGITTTLLQLIDKIEYWYVGHRHNQRVRFHKLVYFYLLEFQSGDTSLHDHEVNEARWFEIDEAHEVLAFQNEKKIVAQAKTMLAS